MRNRVESFIDGGKLIASESLLGRPLLVLLWVFAFSLSATPAEAQSALLTDKAIGTTEEVKPATAEDAGPSRVWEHLRFSLPAGVNFSHDPSDYNGPRSSYVLTSWTTSDGTLLRFRFYLDNYIPREVNGQRVNPTLTSSNIQSSMKEVYIQHKFSERFEFTVGDIRATAHSDNNKRLYEGDGKPIHSEISEIDRVLGFSVSIDQPWGRTEFTLADRGRKDLRWDGVMEALRVSRVSADKLKEAQVTFVNRNGDDAGGVAALHQWQFSFGGSAASTNRINVLSAEWLHGNFFPKRSSSTDAIAVAMERKLMKNGALVAVVDYEWINGPTGVTFYEAGVSAIVRKLGDYSWFRIDCGYRRLDPTAPTQLIQDGPFVRAGIVFDRGKGSTPMPSRIIR
ncbi:MAG TPA: hypothetical protein VJM31_04065 [Vicinamibacterales bacterium]|nr:hypothetical protein [Vicinamibacterales bacterium]